MNKMKILLGLLIFIQKIIKVQANLKFVVQIYQNGASIPIEDLYDSKELKYINAELTATGQRQHYNLGSQMRKEYKEFLPNNYNPQQIYVRSSNLKKTLMSAAAHLQGMFPLDTGDILPSNLNSNYLLPNFEEAQIYIKDGYLPALPFRMQVIPIHAESFKNDRLLLPQINCKFMDQLKRDFYKEKKKIIDFVNLQFNQTYYDYSVASNYKIKDFEDIQDLEANLESDRYNAIKCPEFTLEQLDNATYLASLSWSFKYQQPDLLRALNQPFFHQLIDFMQPVTENKNKSGLKWVMFSAHDTNIHILSLALNFTSIECLLSQRFHQYRTKDAINCVNYPQFASSILIELHQADPETLKAGIQMREGQYFIKIRRNGQFMKLCEKNQIYCQYDEFKERIQLFVKDYNQVCQIDNQDLFQIQSILFSEKEKEKSLEEIYYGSCKYISLIFVESLIIIFFIFYIWIHKKRNQNRQNTQSIQLQNVQINE